MLRQLTCNTKSETTETWRPVVGYEEYYIVSDKGSIRSIRRKYVPAEREMKPAMHKLGYLQLFLCGKGRRENAKVHQVVARAFLPNPHKFKEVMHLNGDKADNRVENLAWSDHRTILRNSVRLAAKSAPQTCP